MSSVVSGPRRWWRRILGTSLVSVLVVGSGAAAFAEGDEGPDDDGDDPDGDLEVAGEGSGEYESCSAGFGLGKVGSFVVMFDDPEIDLDNDGDLVDLVERLEVIAEVDGDDCAPEVIDIEVLDRDQWGEFLDTELGIDPTDESSGFPEYDNRYLALVSHAAADFGGASYRVEVDWRYRDRDPVLHFVKPYQPYIFWDIIIDFGLSEEEESELGLLEDQLPAEDVVSSNALVDPVVLSPAEVFLDAEWFDEDGDAVDAPAEAWTMTLSVDGEVVFTIPDDDESLLTIAGTEYSVAGDLPDGWELVDCAEDVEADVTGIGTFAAEAIGAGEGTQHVVCVAAVAPVVEDAEEPTEEPAEETEEPAVEVVDVVADDDDEEELPATGGAPLGLLALGAGAAAVGARMTRRR